MPEKTSEKIVKIELREGGWAWCLDGSGDSFACDATFRRVFGLRDQRRDDAGWPVYEETATLTFAIERPDFNPMITVELSYANLTYRNGGYSGHTYPVLTIDRPGLEQPIVIDSFCPGLKDLIDWTVAELGWEPGLTLYASLDYRAVPFQREADCVAS